MSLVQTPFFLFNFIDFSFVPTFTTCVYSPVLCPSTVSPFRRSVCALVWHQIRLEFSLTVTCWCVLSMHRDPVFHSRPRSGPPTPCLPRHRQSDRGWKGPCFPLWEIWSVPSFSGTSRKLHVEGNVCLRTTVFEPTKCFFLHFTIVYQR